MIRRCALLTCALALLLTLAHAPTARSQQRAAEEPFHARLAALDPSAPMSWFELAEEAADAGALSLARRLYALSWELAHRSGDADLAARLAPSVCIALADLSPSEDERRWLLALARSVGAPARLSIAPGALPVDADSLALAEALGHHRAGENLRARAALDAVGRRERFLRLDQALAGRAQDILRAIDSTGPCPECRNRRIVRAVAEPGQPWRVCPLCRANPGPALTRAQLLAHLRAEALALGAEPQTWSHSLLLDPSPAREVSLSEIARLLRIDPEAVVYRDGSWRKP